MDGLSGAASAMAVVSLAVQMADSAYRIYKLLESIKEAPEDVIRLKRHVLQLHNVLKGVRDLVEKQNSQELVPPPPEYLYEALKTCEHNVQCLEEQTTKMHRALNQRGLRRVLGALKTSFDKDILAKVDGQMQEAIQVLNLAVLTNQSMLSLTHMDHTEVIIAHFKGSAPSKGLPSQTLTESNNQSKSLDSRSKTFRESSSVYETILGTYRSSTVWFRTSVEISKPSKSGTDSHPVNYYTTITFRPVLISNVFVWEKRQIYGQIARTFQIYPVDQRVYDDITADFVSFNRDRIRDDRALQLFQHRLSNGLNPFLLNKAGSNILWLAVDYGQASIVQLLLQTGVMTMIGSLINLSTYDCDCDPPCDLISSSAEIARAIATSKGSSSRKSRLFNNRTTVTLYWSSEEVGLGTTVTTKNENRGTFQTFFWLAAQSDETCMASECVQNIVAGHRDIHHWQAKETMELITFIFDTIVGCHWLEASDCAIMGHLLLDLSTYACELGPAIHSWPLVIERQGLNVGQAMTELSTSMQDQRNISHLRRREYKLEANGTSFRWIYDPRESAFELCYEYEHLLLHCCYEYQYPALEWCQTWPYNDKCSHSRRLPRKVKKAQRRDLAKLRREGARAPHIPGSFPVQEGEDNSVCPYCGNRCVR